MTVAAGTAPRPSNNLQLRAWLTPEDNRTKATSGPTMRPSACMEKTIPTSRPRSRRFEYSLINTAETG